MSLCAWHRSAVLPDPVLLLPVICLHYCAPQRCVGVLPPVVSAQQGARVVPRLQRESAVPLEVPEHAQDQGVQGAHVQVQYFKDEHSATLWMRSLHMDTSSRPYRRVDIAFLEESRYFGRNVGA